MDASWDAFDYLGGRTRYYLCVPATKLTLHKGSWEINRVKSFIWCAQFPHFVELRLVFFIPNSFKLSYIGGLVVNIKYVNWTCTGLVHVYQILGFVIVVLEAA